MKGPHQPVGPRAPADLKRGAKQWGTDAQTSLPFAEQPRYSAKHFDAGLWSRLRQSRIPLLSLAGSGKSS